MKRCPDCGHRHPEGFSECVVWVDDENRCGCTTPPEPEYDAYADPFHGARNEFESGTVE